MRNILFMMANYNMVPRHERWDGGGGGNRTRVLLSFKLGIYKFSWNFYVFFRCVGNQHPQTETPP